MLRSFCCLFHRSLGVGGDIFDLYFRGVWMLNTIGLVSFPLLVGWYSVFGLSFFRARVVSLYRKRCCAYCIQASLYCTTAERHHAINNSERFELGGARRSFAFQGYLNIQSSSRSWSWQCCPIALPPPMPKLLR
jgi:hypothetical protein